MSRTSSSLASTQRLSWRSTLRATAVVLTGIAGVVAPIAGLSGVAAADAKTSTVAITLTPTGCSAKPSTIPSGAVDFNVTNKNAGAVSEAELRTSDKSHILGEQENLTPGLSGTFSLNLQSGKYLVYCPGASTPYSKFTVSGKVTGAKWQSIPSLKSAVSAYSTYVNTNTANLVSHTQTFCTAINSGSITAAEDDYTQARIYYEHIEPVAEIWGALDIEIDGRWQNPVTVESQFMGFHRIEQKLWQQNTLTGAAALCTGLVKHEQQLLTLVKAATYNPLEMAAGATDLVNEAGTAKVTGEEERYSNDDLPTLQANLDGAQEVITLFGPYLKANASSLLKTLDARYAAATKLTSTYKAAPGYDDSGYITYASVNTAGRRALSGVLNAYAESLSQVSSKVS